MVMDHLFPPNYGQPFGMLLQGQKGSNYDVPGGRL